MKNHFLLLFSFLILWACNSPIKKRFLQKGEIEQEVATLTARKMSPGKGNICCRDYESYIPDTNHLEFSNYQLIRVNFHFTNSTDSTRNFNEKEGKEYVRQLMNYAYNKYHNNQRMLLHPKGKETPVLPTCFKYVLTPRPDDPEDDGVYFHYDDDLYYYIVRGKDRNLGSRDVIKKYGVQLDSVMNIFIMPHHPDSVASETYKAYGCGIAFGNAVKIVGAYDLDIKPWDMQKHLNHEIGHNYGLRHSWTRNDGCDDTPPNPNCWNFTSKPGCDSLASNNVMGYNGWQTSWTPCQIGRMHARMSREQGRGRKFLVPRWCNFDDSKTIRIKENIVWYGEKDLMGHLIIEPNASLEIRCRVSLPKSGKIIVKPGGTLILNNNRLHNACGEQWEGIEIEQSGKIEGEVRFIGQPVIANAKHWAAP